MNTCPVEKIYWAGGEPINNGRALVMNKLVELGVQMCKCITTQTLAS